MVAQGIPNRAIIKIAPTRQVLGVENHKSTRQAKSRTLLRRGFLFYRATAALEL